VISLSQRPLRIQDNTTQKHKDRHPCLELVRTYDPSNQVAKTYALHSAATETGIVGLYLHRIILPSNFPRLVARRSKDFSSSLSVQTMSKAHLVFYLIVARGSFPGGKALLEELTVPPLACSPFKSRGGLILTAGEPKKTRSKSCPPLCPPRSLYGLTRPRNRASVVRPATNDLNA
jgi:hypothetical protein